MLPAGDPCPSYQNTPYRLPTLVCIHLIANPIQEYRNLTRYSNVLGGFGIASAIAAVAPLIDLSHGGDPNVMGIPAVMAGTAVALAGASFWARSKLLDVRNECIVSSSKRWRSKGGLSLVEGVPIKL